jgi:hypothetical protein
MKWLLRLYPRAWRDRYQDEFEAMLAQHGVSMLDFCNIVFMAARTRLTTGQRVERRHARGAAAAGILAVALCVSVGSIALSSLRGPTVQASPAIVTKSIIYHRVNGHWKQTSTLHRGELARFTFSFRQHGFAFTPLHVNWVLQHATFLPTGTYPYGHVVYGGELRTIRRARQSALFSSVSIIPKTLSGHFYLQFDCYSVGVEPPHQISKVVNALDHSDKRLVISET